MVTRPFTGNNNNLLSISTLLKKVNRNDGTDNRSGIVDQSVGYFNHHLIQLYVSRCKLIADNHETFMKRSLVHPLNDVSIHRLTNINGATMLNSEQLHQLAAICRQASDTEIMPRFRKLGSDQVEEKQNHHDLVTIADQAAETFILDKLRALYPDALLIGEESVYQDPAALSQFSKAALSFVLDPIDGTWHYANGSVNFGVMLSVASHGEVVAGIIFEPISGDYMWAIKGQGAFDRVDGQDRPLKAGHQASLPLSETMGCFSFGVSKGEDRPRAIQAVMQMGRVMDYRCAAAEYRLLNTGATAFVIFQGTLNLWDHGAGLLISQEAGAVARMLDGSDYSPQVTGKLLVAESEVRWSEVAALFI